MRGETSVSRIFINNIHDRFKFEHTVMHPRLFARAVSFDRMQFRSWHRVLKQYSTIYNRLVIKSPRPKVEFHYTFQLYLCKSITQSVCTGKMDNSQFAQFHQLYRGELKFTRLINFDRKHNFWNYYPIIRKRNWQGFPRIKLSTVIIL